MATMLRKPKPQVGRSSLQNENGHVVLALGAAALAAPSAVTIFSSPRREKTVPPVRRTAPGRWSKSPPVILLSQPLTQGLDAVDVRVRRCLLRLQRWI